MLFSKCSAVALLSIYSWSAMKYETICKPENHLYFQLPITFPLFSNKYSPSGYPDSQIELGNVASSEIQIAMLLLLKDIRLILGICCFGQGIFAYFEIPRKTGVFSICVQNNSLAYECGLVLAKGILMYTTYLKIIDLIACYFILYCQ